MVVIKMHEKDLGNLDEFLDRVELKGKIEAIALVRIIDSISQAKPVDDILKELKRKPKKDGE